MVFPSKSEVVGHPTTCRYSQEEIFSARGNHGKFSCFRPGIERTLVSMPSVVTTAALSTQRTRQSPRLALIISLTAFIIVALTIAARNKRIAGYGIRHARAEQKRWEAAATCDASLGLRRWWVGSHVHGESYCVSHASRAAPDVGKATLIESDVILSFLVVGDWGRDGFCCQRDVALEMARTADADSNISFVVSTGDNFYEYGLASSHDTQIESSWRDVYLTEHPSLRRPWKIVLGNHDYLGRTSAQKVFSERDELWDFPASYYFETFANGSVFIAFLDTSCLYYSADELDLLQAQKGIMPYDRDNQIAALRRELATTDARWKLVVGHHPLYCGAENAINEARNLAQLRTTLLPIFKQYGVSAYFCGHEHTLEHYETDGFHAFVSGGGSKISHLVPAATQSVFSLDRSGFAHVVLTNSTLLVRFIDLSGSVVHTAYLPPRSPLPSSSPEGD